MLSHCKSSKGYNTSGRRTDQSLEKGVGYPDLVSRGRGVRDRREQTKDRGTHTDKTWKPHTVARGTLYRSKHPRSDTSFRRRGSSSANHPSLVSVHELGSDPVPTLQALRWSSTGRSPRVPSHPVIQSSRRGRHVGLHQSPPGPVLLGDNRPSSTRGRSGLPR